MSVLLTLPITRAFDSAGDALPGAKLYFFATGTSNPKTVYLDSSLSTAATNPVVADSAGRFAALWLDTSAGAYTVKLTDSAGSQVWSVDGVDDQNWTQAQLAALLWPQTSGESVAGVTPTDYTYEPGDVRRYGADTTGATDSSEAFQDAVDANVDVLVPTGTYLLQSAVSLSSGTKIRGVGNPLVQTGGTNRLFQAIGVVGTFAAITSDAARGDSSFEAATDSGSSYVDGYYLRADTDALLYAGHYKGELGIVDSVATDTVSIDGVLLDDYETADSAKAAPVTFVTDIAITGLKLRNTKYTSATTTPTSSLIYFECVNRGMVKNCILSENNQSGIAVANSLDVIVADNIIEKMRDDGANSIHGYGVIVSYASRNVTIAGNVFRKCRHAVTTGTASTSQTPSYGVQRAITVTGNTASDCTSGGLDTHEDSDGVTFSGNSVLGCQVWGVQVRSFRTTITGNVITNCTGYGIRCDNTSRDTTIMGNTIRGTRLNGGSFGYGIEIDSRSVLVSGNSISFNDAHGIILGAGASNFVTVVGNELKNNGQAADGYGIYINRGGTAARINIFGNTCSDDQGEGSTTQDYGIAIAASTTMTALNNIIACNNLASNGIASFNNASSGVPMYVNNVENAGVESPYTPPVGQAPTTFGAADATPPVTGRSFFLTGTAGLTITDFDDGVPGQVITVLSKGAIVYDVTGTNLNGGTTNITTASGDTTQWICEDGTNWRLIAFVDASADNSTGA